KIDFERVRAEAIGFTEMILRLGRTSREELAAGNPTPTSSTGNPTPTPTTGSSTQPTQSAAGPGGSDYAHGDWRVSAGGTGPNAWYVFEPIDPQPATAPLAVVMHGYYEFS